MGSKCCATAMAGRITVLLMGLLTVLGISQKATTADSPLPLIQIRHDDLGDDYPEMQEQVHLEDFFWTGSGDGPPDYLKKVHTGINKGKDVIVKTETVVATVYVDGHNEIDIPICLDCLPDDGGGGGGGVGGFGGTWGLEGIPPPLNYSATDRRYWLLTVMSGFYSQKDNPMLEEKLARLYRLAFTRQQSRHLGLNGSQQIAGISVSTGGESGREHSTESTHRATGHMTSEKPPDSDVEVLDMANSNKLLTRKSVGRHPFNTNSELISSSEEVESTVESIAPFTTELPTSTTVSNEDIGNDETSYVTLIPWELLQQGGRLEKQQQLQTEREQGLQGLRVAQLQNTLPRNDYVRVVIHNMTKITEEDVQKGNLGGLYDDDVNEKIDDRPIANQTELIYSVFVNGRAVLATTAATDMKFVSESEVADLIGKPIYMKAEPYLREPQATPLAPATRSGSVGFIDSIQNNPALVVVSSIAILLLLLLLIALLLMGRTRTHAKNVEVQRTTSRNELLVESRSGRPPSSGTALDTGRSTVQSRDVGVQNYSYESDQERRPRKARINFPGPPRQEGSRRSSITSSDNTSDSSVYCPINPPGADVQQFLDDKAANLFERHKRRHHHQYDRAEGREDAIYTTVVAEKKRDKARHKAKRRYLSENRVGSLETSPTQRSVNSSCDEVHPDGGDSFRATYENFERNEAYNPHNNYHRNKLLHQRSIYPSDDMHAHEAINKEIIRALKPTEKSSDTGSIGSFLSMASVKAFPKSTLPEPLNRVLEPVFVTYYDNVDDSMPPAVHQSAGKSTKSNRSKQHTPKDSLDATTIATIENFPAPKAPNLKSNRMTSQSDNPDPGVIGPVVWERHKKRLAEDCDTDDDVVYERTTHDFSPVRDPAAMRNHYEGLLEGAIQMYSSQDDLPMPLPTRDFTNNRKPTKREFRGSSAGLPSYNNKSYNSEGRPATAQPDKTPKSNQSTQPPSPSLSAWAGSSAHGSNSPLVRPMSAGPFHRPEALHDIPKASSASRGDLTAAPLIEAIQNELRKFKQENQ